MPAGRPALPIFVELGQAVVRAISGLGPMALCAVSPSFESLPVWRLGRGEEDGGLPGPIDLTDRGETRTLEPAF